MQNLFLFFTIQSLASGFSGPDSSDQKFLNWYNASADSMNIQGTGVDKACREILKDKKSTTVIVAVIDGGVDINHVEFKGKIWTNEKEIPGNGLDDDQNGFIDDVHGWNFIGNEKGENITYETFEFTRLVKKFDSIKNQKDIEALSKNDLDDYKLYPAAKKEYDENIKKYTAEKEKIDQIYKGYIIASNNIKSFLDKDSLTPDDLSGVNSPDVMITKSKNYLTYLNDIGYTQTDLEEIKENNYNHLFYHLNKDYNPRLSLHDNIEESGYGKYGNNDVIGDKAEHGTFVSGIIAADRNNNIGINGIAKDVKIMALRVVPDGDERDKDVANAITYAVNNGANIINCSFGKNYSPQKELVDEALKLAQQKGVLIVHASGNEASDNDKIPRYPNNYLLNGEVIYDNWINVGASTMKADKNLPGIFSNYGSKTVDLFAPGVDIYSLYPNNDYHVGNGTSYASPVVSGVAALLKSYYPNLTASELKKIILETTTKFPKLKVYLPDKKDKRKKKTAFRKLSSTGGIVNAYEAVKAAEHFREK